MSTSYDRDTWRTPPWLFRLAECLLPDGKKFDIDLAASHENHLVDKYITKEEDSLELEWGTRHSYGFCNPPYSKSGKLGNVDLFIIKAIQEKNINGFTTIMVIPELNGERRTANIMRHSSRIIHFCERVDFIHPDTGKPVKGNNRGTILVEFSPRRYRHKHYFAERIHKADEFIIIER